MHQDAPASGPAPKPFRWNGRRLLAARPLAEDLLSDEKIAARAGVDRRQLARWKTHPEFAAKVKDFLTAMGERALRFAVARRHRRVQAMNDRWRKLKQVMRERAAVTEMANVPGGTTGLLVRKLKSIGAGENAREVEEFEVDTGLLKEIRDLEKQVAQETGQWSEKRELSGPNGQPITFIEVRLNHESSAAPDRTDDAEREDRPGVQLP